MTDSGNTSTDETETPPWLQVDEADAARFGITQRIAGTYGDLWGTQTNTAHPEKRRVAVDTSWLSYHNPQKMKTLDGLIITREQLARDPDHGLRGAVPCSHCFGARTQYEYPYTEEGGVLP